MQDDQPALHANADSTSRAAFSATHTTGPPGMKTGSSPVPLTHTNALAARRSALVTSRAERWTTQQAAKWCGVQPDTYRSYVTRGYAPSALNERDPVTGAKLHDAAAVREWHAGRPGRGARTDLQEKD
jgi:hypothetical protein